MASLIFLIAFCRNAAPLFAADEVPACGQCFNRERQNVLDQVNHLESNYVQYRWAEEKIRRLYYEKLWPARNDMQNALSKEKRNEGKESEEWFLNELKITESQSRAASNGLVETARKIQQSDLRLGPCGIEKDYMPCIQKSMKPIYDLLDQLQEHFNHVFEHEREYRKSVELSAAGKSGLYPEDALERKTEHTEFFTRFEREREVRHFDENSGMMDFIFRLREMLLRNFSGEACCYPAAESFFPKPPAK